MTTCVHACAIIDTDVAAMHIHDIAPGSLLLAEPVCSQKVSLWLVSRAQGCSPWLSKRAFTTPGFGGL